MPKLALTIEFDRPDRRYRAGEEVTGHVQVEVQGDVGEAELLLEPFWWAHGKGRRHLVAGSPELLRKGPWREGERVQVAFRWQAPSGPPTYLGRLFEIEHYLQARMDVPWAFDSEVKEGFFLVPGSQPHPNQPQASEDPELARRRAQVALFVLGAAAMLMGSFAGPPAGLFLIPGALGLWLFAARSRLLALKLGPVDVRWERLKAAPGDELPVTLRLNRKAALALRSARMTLTCVESCTSGSGKQRKRHRHRVHGLGFDVDLSEFLRSKTSGTVQGVARIPDTAAFSFVASHYRLTWDLEVRLEVPAWFDWTLTRRVIVVPREQLGEPPPAPQPQLEPIEPSAGPAPEEPAMDPAEEAPAPEFTGRLEAEPDPSQAEVAGAEPDASPQPAPELTAFLERLAAIQGYGRERDELIAGVAGQTFACDVEVAGVERTYTPRGDPFRNGRTLTGVVHGTELPVSVQLLETQNEVAEGLERGHAWSGRCRIHGWNLIHRRADLTQIE